MVTLTAALVATTAPQPVQVQVSGLAAGDTVLVEGVCDRWSWPVPGGTFTATADTVALVDNRAALNAPVTYRVTVNGVAAATTTGPVQVAAPGPVLQSIDGGAVVNVDFLTSDQDLAMTGAPRYYEADVTGRADRPARFDISTTPETKCSLVTGAGDNAAMLALLGAGGPLVLRMAPGWAGPLVPPSQVIRMSAYSSAWGGIQLPASYQWDVSYAVTPDPEPSRAVTLSDWTDFNDAMVRLGWDYQALQDFLAGLPDWQSAAQVIWADQ